MKLTGPSNALINITLKTQSFLYSSNIFRQSVGELSKHLKTLRLKTSYDSWFIFERHFRYAVIKRNLSHGGKIEV